MASRHAQDALIEGADFIVTVKLRDQIIQKARLVEPPFDRQGQQPLDLRGKGEPAFALVVVEVPGSSRITRRRTGAAAVRPR